MRRVNLGQAGYSNGELFRIDHDKNQHLGREPP